MGEIKVAFESLQAGQQGIQKTYSTLVSTLEDLENQLKPMISTWTGAAQEQYLSCKRDWDTAAAQLAQVLSQIGQAVGQAHDNYQAAEQAARNNWS